MLLLLLPPPPPRSAGRGAGRRLGSGRCARPGGVCGDIYSQPRRPPSPRPPARPPGGERDGARGQPPLLRLRPARPEPRWPGARRVRGCRGTPAPGVRTSPGPAPALCAGPGALGAAPPAVRHACALRSGPGPPPRAQLPPLTSRFWLIRWQLVNNVLSALRLDAPAPPLFPGLRSAPAPRPCAHWAAAGSPRLVAGRRPR